MRWEYRIMHLHPFDTSYESYFNELGVGGWELVSVANNYAYFKRVKEN